MKGLFFATLPKSGTSFTHSTIASITGLEIPAWMLDSKKMAEWQTGVCCDRRWYWASGEFSSCRLEKEGLRRSLAKPQVITSHLPASHHNLHTLAECGVETVSVLLRDPRDATVSWVHHLRKHGPATAPHTSHFQYLPPAYFEWDLQAQMEFGIATFLPQAVDWVESWLFALTRQDFPGLQANLYYYDELRSRPRQYFRRLLGGHGITQYDESGIQQPKPGENHFRKGNHASWKEEFPESWHSWASQLLTARLGQAFADAAKACPLLGRARGASEAGDSQGATRALEQHLYQFPQSELGWKLAEEQLGIVRGEVDPEVARQCDSAARQFLLPAASLDKFVQGVAAA